MATLAISEKSSSTKVKSVRSMIEDWFVISHVGSYVTQVTLGVTVHSYI
jgi:hypothetical protein